MYIISWIFLLLCFQFAFLPLTLVLPIKKENNLSLYFLSKSIGFLFICFIIWYLTSIGLISINKTTCLLILASIACLNYLIFNKFSTYTSSINLNEAFKAEIIFILAFLFFLSTRYVQPEIFWGEKPMDFSFLNYFIREQNLPPQDPWAAGFKMNYYYFGYYMYGLIHKITGIDSGIGYNLSLATVGTLFFTSLIAVFLALNFSLIKSTFCAFLVACLSNLDWIKVLAFKIKPFGFDMFWATSRTLKSPGINEYPWWSLLFADLHPHLMALPFVATVTALAILISNNSNLYFNKQRKILATCLGISYATLYLLNAWDLFSFGLVVFLAFLTNFIIRINANNTDSKVVIFFSVLFEGLYTLIVSTICLLPSLFSSSVKPSIGWGWCVDSEFDTLTPILIIFAPWLCLIFLSYKIFKREDSSSSLLNKFLVSILIAEIPIILAAISVYEHHSLSSPWGIILLSSFLMFISSFLYLKNDNNKMPAVLIFVSALALTVTQLFFLMDRMNTLFKFYNAIWILLGIAACKIFFETENSYFKFRNPINTLSKTIGYIVISLCIMGSILNYLALANFQRVLGPRPTLDGRAYLKASKNNEAEAMNWIRKNIRGVPVTVEAVGMSYAEFTRFTMHTGLPTILGWEYHVQQRGLNRNKVEERKGDVTEIYSTTNLDRKTELLSKYSAKYVIVGELEKAKYPNSGLTLFDLATNLFTPVYRDNFVAVYEVK